jgi:hypothetical protein
MIINRMTNVAQGQGSWILGFRQGEHLEGLIYIDLFNARYKTI